MYFKHTPATDARIRSGYESGVATRAIASELGVSRNVVIGRARILRLSGTYDLDAARRHQSANLSKAKREYWAKVAPIDRAMHMRPALAALRETRKVNTAHNKKIVEA